ncbi:putative outer membrane starch-binding protein [Arenibacter algicola]|uniref:Outer membrane starch-binding protein n=1 Tax=Arenibacter algicola TaxID=616991 RepID=A0ABY3AGA7_9FLAO
MNKMKQIYLILTALVTILLFGCTKDLDLYSLDELSSDTFWLTANEYKLAANDLYNGLPHKQYEDLKSDIAFQFPNDISNGKLQTSETSSLWKDSYEYIRGANTIIDKGNTNPVEGSDRFVAEAKFFRAFYYFEMFKDFGGVPLIKSVLSETSEELYASRASRADVVNFILEDLTAAASKLPLQSELSDQDIGRITKGTALALKARVALFEGTWQKYHGGTGSTLLQEAVNAASEVISSDEYSLYTATGADSYRNLFIIGGDDSSESILDLRFEEGIKTHGWPQNYDQNGYNITRKMADMYLCVDGKPIEKSDLFQGYDTFISEFENRDPRMVMTSIPPGTVTNRPFFPDGVANWPTAPQRNGNTGYILYKYMETDSDIINRVIGNYFNDIHLIRYAEVLLIYAEALYEKDGSISNDDLDKSINLLRDRVNMPNLSNELVAANALDMRDEIRRERTVELALEGFRYDDLRRWKTAEVELTMDIKGIKIKDSEWQNREPYLTDEYQSRADENGFLISESQRSFDPSKHYLLPLPTKEIALYQSNGYTLEQNPKW